MKQHKWHKEIKAWADGAEIEGRKKGYLTNEFYVLSDPNWNSNHWEFRIKPQPKEPQYLYLYKNRKSLEVVMLWSNDFEGNLLRYIGKIKLEVEE